MKKLIHYIEVRVIIKDETTFEKVRSSFVSLFPFDLKTEKLILIEEILKPTKEFNLTLKKISLSLKKQKHISKFVDSLFDKLGSDQVTSLSAQLEQRLDEDLNFFVRLDLSKLCAGKYVLTDSGNCVHLKMVVAAFPKKRSIALEVLSKLLTAARDKI